jgi:hypothetical protein
MKLSPTETEPIGRWESWGEMQGGGRLRLSVLRAKKVPCEVPIHAVG